MYIYNITRSELASLALSLYVSRCVEVFDAVVWMTLLLCTALALYCTKGLAVADLEIVGGGI